MSIQTWNFILFIIFGYGLSYTSFEYSGLKIQEKDNGNVAVQATVKNVGQRAGDEVVQLYITDICMPA